MNTSPLHARSVTSVSANDIETLRFIALSWGYTSCLHTPSDELIAAGFVERAGLSHRGDPEWRVTRTGLQHLVDLGKCGTCSKCRAPAPGILPESEHVCVSCRAARPCCNRAQVVGCVCGGRYECPDHDAKCFGKWGHE